MRPVRSAVAVLLVVLAGCGGSGTTKVAAPPIASSTTIASLGCGAGPFVAASSTDMTTGRGDFDGDGRPDVLSTYRVGGAGTWHVRVELAAGGAVETELPATATGVRAIGGSSLDPQKGDAAFVVVGTGNGGSNIGLFVLKACTLTRATLAGGALAEFPVQVGALARTGVTCQVPGLVIYSAVSTDGQFYTASSVSYLLIGPLLDEAHRNMMSLPASDPSLTAFGSFTCGGLKL